MPEGFILHVFELRSVYCIHVFVYAYVGVQYVLLCKSNSSQLIDSDCILYLLVYLDFPAVNTVSKDCRGSCS